VNGVDPDGRESYMIGGEYEAGGELWLATKGDGLYNNPSDVNDPGNGKPNIKWENISNGQGSTTSGTGSSMDDILQTANKPQPSVAEKSPTNPETKLGPEETNPPKVENVKKVEAEKTAKTEKGSDVKEDKVSTAESSGPGFWSTVAAVGSAAINLIPHNSSVNQGGGGKGDKKGNTNQVATPTNPSGEGDLTDDEAKVIRDEVVKIAESWRGKKRYRNRCSEWVNVVYTAAGVKLFNASIHGYRANVYNEIPKLTTTSFPLPGDIIQFDKGGEKAASGHVAVYIGGGKMISTSSDTIGNFGANAKAFEISGNPVIRYLRIVRR
jgi:cell wall-associated NlpC family hydrolase